MHRPRPSLEPPRPNPSRRGRLLAVACAVFTLALASCTPPVSHGAALVPDPPRGGSVANHWGRFLVPSRTGVSYGPESHQLLDVLPATGPVRRGTLVFVHGGGFTIGERSDLLRGDHGAVVHQRTRGWDIVSVGYQVGAGSYPQPYHDVALAVRWVRDHGAGIGLDTSKVVLAGHSAGGSLVAMVATTPGAATPYGAVPRVDGWVSVSAVHDWANGGSYISNPWGMPAAHRALRSPVNTLDPTDPPGYLVHGDLDPIVRPLQSERMHARAATVGARLQFDLVDTGDAACRMHEPLCGANIASLDAFLS